MKIYLNEDLVEYNSFIYMWEDLYENKYYIGSHIGNVNDGYLFGGIDIKRKYRERPFDFIRKILSYHIINSNFEIRSIEKEYLEKFDVENNDNFYNRTNESYGGYHKKSVESRLSDIDDSGLNSFQRASRKMVLTRKRKNNYKTAKIKEHLTKKSKMLEISSKISDTLKGSTWINKDGEKKYVKPADLEHYLLEGWQLGMRKYSYKECEDFAKKNNINSCKEWVKLSSENNLPVHPERTFKNEWVSWSNFLGKKVSKNYTYLDCINYVVKLNINTKKEWYYNASLYKLPYHPDRKFKDVWNGWEEFLKK